MYYKDQPKEQREAYKNMLCILGKLSNLFSDSDTPYLASRVQENAFCKYFEAENLSRGDVSADASKGSLGIGLKTWMGQDNQKVAEFGAKGPELRQLEDKELVKRVSEYRNKRISFTKNAYALDKMIYHIVKRVPGAMMIYEHAFEPIDIDNIELIERGGDNTVYFTDGNHTYNFNKSKTTLYMIFEDLELVDKVEVEILDDPFKFLETIFSNESVKKKVTSQKPYEIPSGQQGIYLSEDIADIFKPAEKIKDNQLCLRLYSTNKDGKFVAERSGLNQWNAQGRKRHPDELYIPYPAVDRKRIVGFFPPRDTKFKLLLPDGSEMDAKVCQADGKAIMSDPNKDLGHWLLRDVLELKINTLVTYDMLTIIGVDSVIFTKADELKYSVDFAPLGTYENLYGESDGQDQDEEEE